MCVFYGFNKSDSADCKSEQFATLEKNIIDLKDKGLVMLAGDFNARVGQLCGNKGEDTVNGNGQLLG